MAKRQKPEVRRGEIMDAAVREAADMGILRATCEGIACRAGCSPQLVKHYYGTMTQLRRDLMRYAVRNELAHIVAQGLALRDTHALKAPKELKEKAAKWLQGGR